MLEDDEMFCHECGAKQEIEETEAQIEEPSSSEEKFCVHCGKAIEIDSMFCSFCGKPQDVEAEQKEESWQEPSEQPKQPERPLEPQEPGAEEQPTYEYEEEKKSKTLLWVLLALLIVGGAGWYFFIKDSGNSMYELRVDSDSIEEIVDSIYDEEAYDAFSVEGVQARLNDILSKALMMREDDAVRTYFSEEFRGLYARVAEKDSHLDGPGFWNGNIWDGGQDGDPGKYTIIRVSSPNDNKADAGVKFSYDMEDYHSDNLITIKLVFENGDWYIDDVDANKQGMVTYLKEEDSSSDTDEVSSSEDSGKSQLRGNELSIRKLTEKDIEGLSSGELEILRNVVYARYGYLFQREDLRRFFLQYSWYQPTNKDANEIYDNFTEIERYNIDFIKRHE